MDFIISQTKMLCEKYLYFVRDFFLPYQAVRPGIKIICYKN